MDDGARRYSGIKYYIFQATSFLTFIFFLSFSANHRSYCICWFSQLSEVVSKAIDRRIAISGLTLACPFNTLDRVLRLTPSAFAASVTDNSKGSIHNSLMISPGCGGLCINIVYFSALAIQVTPFIRRVAPCFIASAVLITSSI